MVAFIFSSVLSLAMVAVIILVGIRRPPGTPLTWGEAFVAAVYVFALFLMIYGIVPHQWLTWADNEMGWRNDRFGIPFFGRNLFENGISLGGRGRITITAVVIRDIVATGIYVVAIGGQLFLWKWWQSRGKRADTAKTPAAVTSAFGRRVLKEG